MIVLDDRFKILYMDKHISNVKHKPTCINYCSVKLYLKLMFEM